MSFVASIEDLTTSTLSGGRWSALVGTRYPRVPAGTTAVYTARLLDVAGQPVPGDQLTALTLTLLDALTGDVVNHVDAANVLNAGRGRIDDAGNVTITLGAPPDDGGDTALLTPTDREELRSLLLGWTMPGVTGAHRADFLVLNLDPTAGA